MVRKAAKRDVQAIIKLLHQVDMVHHVIRPDLFKPNTTKYRNLKPCSKMRVNLSSFMMMVKSLVMPSV